MHALNLLQLKMIPARIDAPISFIDNVTQKVYGWSGFWDLTSFANNHAFAGLFIDDDPVAISLGDFIAGLEDLVGTQFMEESDGTPHTFTEDTPLAFITKAKSHVGELHGWFMDEDAAMFIINGIV